MTQTVLSVSVVICAYSEDRWLDLLAAVDSVLGQTHRDCEIIVVIDHNPALLDRVRASLPDVLAIENREQRGLGGARNSGIAVALGDIIAFLDDDAMAASDWIEKLAAEYEEPAVVGVGGSIEPMWQGRRPAWFPEEFYWVVGCTYRGLPQSARPVRNLIGCNMSFRRELFEQIGTFRLGYGCDETELSIRVGQRWPHTVLLYQPLAKVSHRIAETRSTWSYYSTRCYFEGGSKAVVAWLSGSKDGLASERSYTLRVLPRGVLRNLADAIVHGDRAGIGRAGAIVAGLFITTAGYVVGTLFTKQAARRRGWYEQAQQPSI
jgi:glucosyl-dolichyl phosphate glucuronosyltransferase